MSLWSLTLPFSRKKLFYGLIAAFALETFCVTYGLLWPPLVPFLTCVYPVAGLSIAFGWLLFPEAICSLRTVRKTMSRPRKARRAAAIAIKTAVMCYLAIDLMEANPLLVENADMLPIMKVMATRFYQGRTAHVYDKIPEIWGGIQPIYLPAMWLPFTLAVACGADVRWATVGGLSIAFAIFLVMIKPFKRPWPVGLLSAVAAGFFWWLLKDDVFNFIPLTEEGIVVCYYALLVLALLIGNNWFIGMASALCLMSRYAFVGWLPALAIYLAVEGEWRNLIAAIASGILVVLSICVLPFGLRPLELLTHLPGEYIGFAKRVWQDSSEFFGQTMGFAKFFGPERIALQHNLLLVSSLVLPSVFVCICLYIKNRMGRPLHNIPLAALKLTLVVFFDFVDVPYLYLFYTSSFVSLIGLAYFSGVDLSGNQKESGA